MQKPEISFYALWDGEDLLGFGALKELEPRAGEIKSMRTADAHCEGVLRRRFSITSLPRPGNDDASLSLETGSGPAFGPALKLYRKFGFSEGGAFAATKESLQSIPPLDCCDRRRPRDSSGSAVA